MAVSGWVWVGIGLMCLGQFTASAGMLMMKRASNREAHKPFFQRRWWWLGLFSFISNAVFLDAVIYMTTPIVIIAPLNALGLVFSTLLAAVGFLVPKERLPKVGWMAMVVIVAGVVIASVYGPKNETSPTMADMVRLVRRPAFLYPVLSAVGLAGVTTCLLLLKLLKPRSHLKVILCALAATTFGSLSVICFKAVSICILNTVNGHNQFDQWQTYIFIVAVLAIAPTNIVFMNKTFEEASAMYGMPLYQSLFILSTIGFGGLFYDEFPTLLDNGAVVPFTCGVVLAISGVLALAYFSPKGSAAGSTRASGIHDITDSLMGSRLGSRRPSDNDMCGSTAHQAFLDGIAPLSPVREAEGSAPPTPGAHA